MARDPNLCLLSSSSSVSDPIIYQCSVCVITIVVSPIGDEYHYVHVVSGYMYMYNNYTLHPVYVVAVSGGVGGEMSECGEGSGGWRGGQ